MRIVVCVLVVISALMLASESSSQWLPRHFHIAAYETRM
jgi:hypothetical protein